jgi:hypothetical protein
VATLKAGEVVVWKGLIQIGPAGLELQETEYELENHQPDPVVGPIDGCKNQQTPRNRTNLIPTVNNMVVGKGRRMEFKVGRIEQGKRSTEITRGGIILIDKLMITI